MRVATPKPPSTGMATAAGSDSAMVVVVAENDAGGVAGERRGALARRRCGCARREAVRRWEPARKAMGTAAAAAECRMSQQRQSKERESVTKSGI